MRELLKARGFKITAVIDKLKIPRSNFYKWGDEAPINQLLRISDFTHIPIAEIIDCYRPAPGAIDTDQEGGDQN